MPGGARHDRSPRGAGQGQGQIKAIAAGAARTRHVDQHPGPVEEPDGVQGRSSGGVVAADAGIQAGSIYHHFPSKQALFTEVLRDGIGVMVTAFHASPPGLHPHVRAHLGALFEHGPYTAAHVTAFFTAPESVRQAIVPVRDGYEALWNGLLQELLPHLDHKEIALHRLILFGAMNTTIEWFDQHGDLTLDDLATAISDQFLDGVGTAAEHTADHTAGTAADHTADQTAGSTV